MRKALHLDKIAQEPAGQINQMDPLIDQLTTTCLFWIGPPLLGIAQTPTMPIASTYVHEFTQCASLQELPGFAACGMIAMVKPDPYQDLGVLRRRHDRREFRSPPGRWL